MNQSFTSLCSEFARKAQFNLSFLAAVPNDKIMEILKQDGWKVVTQTPTPQQLAAMGAALGRGALLLNQSTVKSRDDKDALFGDDEATKEAFRTARRRAAAQVYGVSPN